MTIDAPREDLVRMTESLRLSENDGNTLHGYAAVFNKWTTINSWEGEFKERIAPGAFKKTLAERADKVKVLFNHGMDPSIGNKPLGKPSVMEEDGRGLKVEVPLDDTSYNADIKALLRSGALDGMSFRMTVVQDEWDKLDGKKGQLPERTIKEVRLFEFGPVTFPAYEATKAGVRAHAPSAFEAWRSATGAPKITVPEEREDPEVETEDRSDPDPPADPEVTGPPDEPPVRHSPPPAGLRLAQIRRSHDLAEIDRFLSAERPRTDDYRRRYERLERGA